MSLQSRACCCLGCATRIPTCFGNRQLPAIISQQTNVSRGFIAYIRYFELHSPKSMPGNSGLSGCFPNAPPVRQPAEMVRQAERTQSWSFSPTKHQLWVSRGLGEKITCCKGVRLVLDPEWCCAPDPHGKHPAGGLIKILPLAPCLCLAGPSSVPGTAKRKAGAAPRRRSPRVPGTCSLLSRIKLKFDTSQITISFKTRCFHLRPKDSLSPFRASRGAQSLCDAPVCAAPPPGTGWL